MATVKTSTTITEIARKSLDERFDFSFDCSAATAASSLSESNFSSTLVKSPSTEFCSAIGPSPGSDSEGGGTLSSGTISSTASSSALRALSRSKNSGSFNPSSFPSTLPALESPFDSFCEGSSSENSVRIPPQIGHSFLPSPFISNSQFGQYISMPPFILLLSKLLTPD